MQILHFELNTDPGHAFEFSPEAIHYGLMLHERRARGADTVEEVSFHVLRADMSEATALPGVAPNAARMEAELGMGTEVDLRLVRTSAFKADIEKLRASGHATLRQVFIVARARAGAPLSPRLGLILRIDAGAGRYGETTCVGAGPFPQPLWRAEGPEMPGWPTAIAGDDPKVMARDYAQWLNDREAKRQAEESAAKIAKEKAIKEAEDRDRRDKDAAEVARLKAIAQAQEAAAIAEQERLAKIAAEADAKRMAEEQEARRRAQALLATPADILARASWRMARPDPGRWLLLSFLLVFGLAWRGSNFGHPSGVWYKPHLAMNQDDLLHLAGMSAAFWLIVLIGSKWLRAATLRDLKRVLPDFDEHYRTAIVPNIVTIKQKDKLYAPMNVGNARNMFYTEQFTLQGEVLADGVNPRQRLGLANGVLASGQPDRARFRRMATTLQGGDFPKEMTRPGTSRAAAGLTAGNRVQVIGVVLAAVPLIAALWMGPYFVPPYSALPDDDHKTSTSSTPPMPASAAGWYDSKHRFHPYAASGAQGGNGGPHGNPHRPSGPARPTQRQATPNAEPAAASMAELSAAQTYAAPIASGPPAHAAPDPTAPRPVLPSEIMEAWAKRKASGQ